MKNIKLFGIITLAALVGFAACDNGIGPDTGAGWIAAADGAANTTTSTKITFTFDKTVTGLTANDITLTDGTGSATKGSLTGSETSWELGITVNTAGTVSVKITKGGVNATPQDVTVHKAGGADITWTLSQVGGVAGTNGSAATASTTAILITFSGAVSLTDADITIGGAASRDSSQVLTSSGNAWTVPVTANASDEATVTVNKTGVTGGQKRVMVYKIGEVTAITWTAAADGMVNTTTSTKITFTFNEAVTGLTANDITLTDGTGSAIKGSLTPGSSETSWELDITVTIAGTVSVTVAKDGVSATPHDVTVHKMIIIWELSQVGGVPGTNGGEATADTTDIVITFSEEVSLEDDDITIGGVASRDYDRALSSSGNAWTVPVTPTASDNATVDVNKTGVEGGSKAVMVYKAGAAPPITWTAAADGTATSTSTKITFTFSAAVTGLTADDITLTDVTGSVTAGALTGSGTSWELGITVTTEGTVSVKVTKDGVSVITQNVTVHKPITWTAVADGTVDITTSTKITFTFNEAVTDLTADVISLTAGTGSATAGALTGSGTSWELGITVATAGTVAVAVTKDGVSETAQNVTVHKAAITWTAAADGTANTTSTKITFTFNSAVSGLAATDITLTDGTGAATAGALTGSGTSWELGITVTTAGTVSVKITKDGVSATAQNVTVHKPITWTVVADGTASTVTSTKITFTFDEAVSELKGSDITLTDGTGKAIKGRVAGSDTKWNVGITVITEGTVSVAVTKDGISDTTETVTVHKSTHSIGGNTTWLYDANSYLTLQVTFSVISGTSGTYELNSGNEWDELLGEGTYTWDENAKTVTLTATKVADWEGNLLDQSEMKNYYLEMIRSTVEEELEYYTDGEWGMGMTQEEAEDFFLGYYNEELGTDYQTVEEYIEGEAAKRLGDAFAPRPYVYILDEIFVLLEALPDAVGTDELAGKTYYGTTLDWDTYEMVKDEEQTYVFSNNGTYTADNIFETSTGTYSYNSTTKQVYLKPDTIDNQTPEDYYASVEYNAEWSIYPTEAAERTGETNKKFILTKYGYDTDEEILSIGGGFGGFSSTKGSVRQRSR